MIAKYLDASTGHLPIAEREMLTAGLDNSCPHIIEHEYGWWIHVPLVEVDYEDLSDLPELTAVLRYAKERDCQWVNFDADAALVVGLRFYEDGDS